MLRELAELTMLDEGDPQSFRVRAYESAAQAIAAQATDLGKLTAQELQKIEGIGKSTADEDPRAARDRQGRQARGAAREAPARAWSRCCASRAWGPRRCKRLRAELGVQSIDDLRGALAAHKLRDAQGLRRRSRRRSWRRRWRASRSRASLERTPISVALPLATRIVGAHARGPRRHARLVLRLAAPLLGDDRRRRHRRRRRRDAEPVMEALRRDAARRSRARARRRSKTSVVTRRGTQVDLRVVAPHQLGAALLYFTGSKGHNIKLRSARSPAAGR